MRILILALALAVPATVAAQSVYRCKDAAGATVFQQHPCPEGRGAEVVVRPTNVIESEPAGEAGLRAIVSRRPIGGSGLQHGMTEEEVVRLLGQPTIVNSDYVNGRVSRQFVYRYPDGSTRYVYTGESGLYAVQNRPAVVRRPTEPCHSALELRNAEVGLNSPFKTEAERRSQQNRLNEMRRCRR